ncbi:ComEC/Rec2 family competence protein [Humisphaera borealis]|uniref:MBL fold metallo-hydrolase n=1 Tax=Humisphaera borealis TaxID=2807512 RepID=A0A7M2X0U3_9BACT|nr:MBL fold metallo-hydrolase [Humisphaera borealis]QOV90731.1 MBL fold metallo-hydrolase [Humisphaera borealis]
MRRILTALLALIPAASVLGGAADKKLDVYWIDVEGGGGTLIVTPAGESILIDSGNPADAGKPPRDSARIVKVAKEVAGLTRIDFFILTHNHRDHFGGIAEVAAQIPVGTVYDNGEFPGGRERPSAEYLAFKADKRVVLNPGDTLPLKNLDAGPKVSLTCVAARKEVMKAPADAKTTNFENPRRKPDDFSDNANSIASLIRFGDWSMFVGGDLTWNIEEKLAVPANILGQVDVYQSTHHGLDVSNNPVVIKSVAPTVVVITNGSTKGCMPEMVQTVRTTDSIVGIYQLHRNERKGEEKNNVPDEFIANPKKECDGNYIKCAVAPDAKAYTLTVPATKHEQKYDTK